MHIPDNNLDCTEGSMICDTQGELAMCPLGEGAGITANCGISFVYSSSVLDVLQFQCNTGYLSHSHFVSTSLYILGR